MDRSGSEYEEEDGCDRSDQPIGSESSNDSREIGGSVPLGVLDAGRSSGGITRGLPGRIRDVLRDGAEGDLSLGSMDVENGIMQWLRALDLQVVGGCRADERLRPLLEINVSSGAAEDQLMAQLIQHFEASEIAVLARCLCVPLVSVRVGKISKHGKILCPTATRGFLSLILLPSSHMRISFTGDDGCIERLAFVSGELEDFSVTIEEISADTSARSFLLKLPCSRVLYFWCSEKSKTDGMELIVKMKDLLKRKPSLSDLTGISEARLDSFVMHFQAYLLASANIPTVSSSSCCTSLITAFKLHTSESDLGRPDKSSRIHITEALTAKTHTVYQSSLSPRLNTFKDATLKNSSTRNGVREKIRRQSNSSTNIQHITPSTTSNDQSTRHESEIGEKFGSQGLLLPSFPSISSPLFSLSSISDNPSRVGNQNSFFSPYYCWCPPFPTSLQYKPTHPPSTSSLPLPLPPLSTLLSAAPPESLNITELPSINFPSLLPEPLVNLSCSVNSLCPLPSSQQVPTFTPFLSDPIIHIPVIDVCSSGQGYLVSAGPAISSSIPPLPISHVGHQLLSPTESPVERNPRETLRMLMASASTSATSKLLNVLPEVFSSMESCGPGASVSPMQVPGIRGLFGDGVDIEPIESRISFLGMSSASDDDLSDKVCTEDSKGCNCTMRDNSSNDLL